MPQTKADGRRALNKAKNLKLISFTWKFQAGTQEALAFEKSSMLFRVHQFRPTEASLSGGQSVDLAATFSGPESEKLAGQIRNRKETPLHIRRAALFYHKSYFFCPCAEVYLAESRQEVGEIAAVVFQIFFDSLHS